MTDHNPPPPNLSAAVTPARKTRLPWWGWLLIGVGIVILLIVIIGSINAKTPSGAGTQQRTATASASPSKNMVAPPNVVGMTVADARAAIQSVGLEFGTTNDNGETDVVTEQNVSTPVAAGSKVTVTAEAPAPDISFDTQTYTGNGDNVVDVNITVPAVVTFDCPNCSRNTVLKTNGAESLLVNTIGAYNGQHLINLYDNSVTTRFTVESVGDWTITVQDLTSVEKASSAASGTGDRVVYMTGTFDTAAIANDGDHNFVVQAFGGNNPSSLIVNEIGAYQGTVELTGPAFIQVESSGNWSITPQ